MSHHHLANRQGQMVADNVYSKNRSFKGILAMAVRLNKKMLKAKMLKAKTLPYNIVYVHPGSHVGTAIQQSRERS